MNLNDFLRHLYLIPLMPMVVVAALSVAHWFFLVGKALRGLVLRKMVRQAGRVFGRRDVLRWLAESERFGTSAPLRPGTR